MLTDLKGHTTVGILATAEYECDSTHSMCVRSVDSRVSTFPSGRLGVMSGAQ